MDYVLQFRQFIGHRPVLMVGAAILVLDEQNRLPVMPLVEQFKRQVAKIEKILPAIV